jgi:beta-lactamase regulating signal transducer with metallopeptidase domain
MTDAVVSTLLQQSILLSVAVVVLCAARPLLRRMGAGLTYAAWSLVPLLLLTPALPRPNAEPVLVTLTAAGGAPAKELASFVMASQGSTAPWLALWVGGTLVVLALQFWRQWRLVRLGEQLPAGSSPALVGLLTPRIALPVDFDERFKPAERELILVHEEVHRDRLDNLWNLLASLLVAWHWWNPLAWWGARRLQADQELACDAAVLQSRPNCHPIYAQALLAAHGLRPALAPIASRWTSAHPLIERIAMLNHPVRTSRRNVAMLGCALVACTALAWAGQGQAKGDATTSGLKLDLSLAHQLGDRVNRVKLAMAGRQGEAMRMETQGDGSEASPPMAVDLTARVLEAGQVQIDAVLWQGRPLAVVARPRLVVKLNETGMVEQLDAGTSRRTTLVVLPSLFELPPSQNRSSLR